MVRYVNGFTLFCPSYADTLVRIVVVREYNLGPQIPAALYTFSISEGRTVETEVFTIPVSCNTTLRSCVYSKPPYGI